MKRYKSVLIIVIVLAMFLPLKAQAAAEAGKVLAVQRKAFLLRDENVKRARPQMQLYLKDAVTTAANSRTKLYFTDDSILNLGQLSRLEIREYMYNAERGKSIYKLLDGTLKVVVGRSDLEIHTPTAVAAARGTKFIVWVEGSGRSLYTGIMVTEGEVLVRNIADGIDEAVSVHEGQMSVISSDKPPERPFAAETAALKRMKNETVVMGTIMRDENSFQNGVYPADIDKDSVGNAGMGMGLMDTGGMGTGGMDTGGMGTGGMGTGGMGTGGMGTGGMGTGGMDPGGMDSGGMGSGQHGSGAK